MHLIRRSALRAASQSSSLFTKPQSITTSSPLLLRSKVQSGISSSVFRRFKSDDTTNQSNVESADGEDHSTVKSAINSVSETASTYAHNAAQSLKDTAEQAKESMSNGAADAAAATGFAPRSSRAEDGLRYSRRDPSALGSTPSNTIYIGNLLFDINAEDLNREFEQFGVISKAVVAMDGRGISKGFGYVTFETIEQAKAAIEAKHQTVMEGRRLVVNYQTKTERSDKRMEPTRTLFIGNLAFEMSDADLNKLFRDIRDVIDVRVAIDRRTGQPRGFAHADFTSVESAIEGRRILESQEVFGRKLRLDYSMPTRPRSDDGLRSGGRGRGYGDREGGGRNYDRPSSRRDESNF